MSLNTNNSYSEKLRHLRARTIANWHLENPTIREFTNIDGVDSERTVRRTGQIDYITQGVTNPNSIQQGCACNTCEAVGAAPTYETVNIGAPVDNGDGTYTTAFSWAPVSNATAYTFTSTEGDAVFALTGATSATITTANQYPGFRIIALNACSSVTSDELYYCFLAGSLVRMADGTDRVIEDIAVGDLIMGAFGEINPVLALHRSKLGPQQIININDEHKATANHPHIGPDYGFYVADITGLMGKTYGRMHTVIDADGNKVQMMLHGLNPGRAKQLTIGTVLQKVDGPRTVDTLTHENMDPDTDLYNLVVGGSHTYYVDGYAVTGWPREDDFDYDTWTTRV